MTSSPSPKNVRVLVAEDDATSQRLMKAMLQAVGIEPLIVSDGAAALAAARRTHFDLIFTDVEMPVMDGLTAVEGIREIEKSERRERTPVYVVSALQDEEDIQAALSAGADGHLPKPLAVASFLETLKAGLERRAGEQDLARARTVGTA